MNEELLASYIKNTFFKNTTRGVFLDVGAHNGIYNSLTKILYDDEWEGYNVEPNIFVFDDLQKNRSRNKNFNIGLSNKTRGEKLHVVISPSTQLKSGSSALGKPPPNQRCKVIDVEIISYCEFIETQGISHIDFMSLDIEGHEIYVLEDMSKSLVLPDVMCIEICHSDSRKIEDILAEKYIKHDNNISRKDEIYVKRI